MKKYLLVTLAAIMAVGFSAFTPAKKIKSGDLETPYHYWYETLNGSTISDIIYSNSGTAMDGDHVRDLQNFPCGPEGDDVVCLRGSNEAKSLGNPIPGVDTENEIRKDLE